MAAADGTKDMDALIEDYLEGRLRGTEKDRFEAKLRGDKDFRARVETTTRSIELVRSALVKVDPGGNFEDEVSSKILSITQSNPNLRPFRASDAGLPAVKDGPGDPDRKLFKDPQADQEQKRLMGLAVIAAILFAAGVGLIAAAWLSSRHAANANKPPVTPSPNTAPNK